MGAAQAQLGGEAVPLFRTWRVAYGAVIACNLVVLLLLFLFSGWAF